MLLGIDWFVVEDSKKKAAINALFLCEMVVSSEIALRGICFFVFLCILQRPLQLEFYTYLPKQERNTKSSSNPFNANFF